jgi:hypothetical protein
VSLVFILPRSGGAIVLSAVRTISAGGKAIRKTPILVPSFSSKAFENVRDMLRFAEELITNEVLVSAYDIHYNKVPATLRFPSLVFLDSGGYEASVDQDLSDVKPVRRAPQPWTTKMHSAVIARWNFSTPTVLVSYDHPKRRKPVQEQIEMAKRLFSRYPQAASTLLFKPRSHREQYVDIDEVIQHRHELSSFSILGFTEKELGPSLLKRMTAIAKVRRALQDVNLDLPIHVFGSLDTISTPLYFLSGADIFDGLTWLRYAFREGNTIYKYHHGALSKGINVDDYKLNGQTWNDNYYYILKMQDDMGRFITTHDYSAFRWHTLFLKESFESLQSELGGA